MRPEEPMPMSRLGSRAGLRIGDETSPESRGHKKLLFVRVV